MRRLWELAVHFYREFVVAFFTANIIALLIFGGTFKIDIYWNSWDELFKQLLK